MRFDNEIALSFIVTINTYIKEGKSTGGRCGDLNSEILLYDVWNLKSAGCLSWQIRNWAEAM